MNSAQIMKQAAAHRERMIRFLREIVAIPSPTGQERRVVERIRREMLRAKCFDRVWTDPLGNLLARIGRGPRLIAIDAHVDTVGLGDPAEWRHDPYRGKVAGGLIYGRGAGDQKGAVPAMIYGMKILRDLKLLPPDCSVLLTCTVMEEDCDGLCWQYIVKEDRIRPECVVVTDSTNCRVLRGQRGRMEIGVTAKGRSCHGSMPEKGDNAVYKIARVIREIEQLNGRLKKNAFLGNGTITVSYVDCKTPSMCAVPGEAYIHLDRRLTVGETRAAALSQVRQALRRAGVRARVRVPRYSRPSYTGVVYETDHYFPTWCQPEDAPQVQAAVDTCRALFRQRQTPSRWTFSTNAVSIAGMFGIPCVGFGPAEEAVAHTVNDRVPVEHLVKCAAFYAGFPAVYCNGSPSS